MATNTPDNRQPTTDNRAMSDNKGNILLVEDDQNLGFVVQDALKRKGYTVHLVNPGQAGREILGQTVYATLADVPPTVDVVDVFRNSEAALEVTRAAIRLKDQLQIKAVWMQIGVRNDVAAAEAEAAGLKVVMDRCPKIEYAWL